MKKGTPLSDELRGRIRNYPGHRYELAIRTGISPSTLSAWQHRIYNPPLNDSRALRLAKLLDVPASDAFVASAPDCMAAPDAKDTQVPTTQASPLVGDGSAS